MSMKGWVCILLLLAGSTLISTSVWADQAIVVGINLYPELGEGAALEGCVQDARSMSNTLKKSYNFENVLLLTDAQATRQGILDALEQVKKQLTPSERFVFYFAGHGTHSADTPALLLTYDSERTTEERDIPALDLYNAVNAIPARSRTVILDSCFSGAMMRSLNRLRMRSRFYRRPTTKDLVPIKVNRQDQNNNVSIPGRICYFAATRGDETAEESDFGPGGIHGIFTYFLTSHLNGGKILWGDIQKVVSGDVSERAEDMQHPTLSPAYVATTVFEAKESPHGQAQPSSLWDVYSGDHVDPDYVQVKMTPDKAVIGVGEPVTFSTTVGNGGYLVLLEHGVSNNVNLLFPAAGNVADAQVGPGKPIPIPADPEGAFAPDTPGAERIKAIWFRTPEAAASLLSQFSHSRSLPWLQWKQHAKERKLVEGPSTVAEFYTSDIDFEVQDVTEANP